MRNSISKLGVPMTPESCNLFATQLREPGIARVGTTRSIDEEGAWTIQEKSQNTISRNRVQRRIVFNSLILNIQQVLYRSRCKNDRYFQEETKSVDEPPPHGKLEPRCLGHAIVTERRVEMVGVGRVRYHK